MSNETPTLLTPLLPLAQTLLTALLTLLATVSAGLFQDTVRLCNLNGPPLLPSLLLPAILSLLMFLHLVRERACGRVFYCDFIVSLSLPVSYLIGAVYVLGGQRNFYEELLFKVIGTYLMGKSVDLGIMKRRKPVDGGCSICLEELGRRVIGLKCGHVFHEECVWRWGETKRACPLCLKEF